MTQPPNSSAEKKRGWRGIRTRLIGVLLVPTLAAFVFGGLEVQRSLSESTSAARAESLASALPDSFTLGIQLTVERDAVKGAVPGGTIKTIRGQTDSQLSDWSSHLAKIDYSEDAVLQDDLLTINRFADDIGEMRDELDDPTTRERAQEQYTDVLNVLFGLADHLPEFSDEDIFKQVAALSNLEDASAALRIERQVMGQALATGKLGGAPYRELIRAQNSYAQVSQAFYQDTSPAAQELFDQVTRNTSLNASVGAPMQKAVVDMIETQDPAAVGMNPAEWQEVSASFITGMRSAIVQAARDVADAVSEERSSAERAAIVNAVIIFLVLFVALSIAMLAARSILRPLGQLRRAALGIAHRRLPQRVKAIEEADGPVDTSVESVGIGAQDEIGEVADAFDAVHGEAVRLAGDQAQMRANVNRMFVNLSRRSTSLVEQQLRLIDELEANEQNPDELANLFRLDHLATRMRRNDESLLVLAGGDSGQARRGEVPVIDVLRAAGSEIEQFARVQVQSTETAEVPGKLAADLVHLLAELIENATNFSPPSSPVVVATARTSPSSPLVIEIRDVGIGMTIEELDEANIKLSQPGRLDADVARMMGLVVSARLAARHDLIVDLRPNSPRGTIARVQIPAAALATEGDQLDQLDEFEGEESVMAMAAAPEPPELEAVPQTPYLASTTDTAEVERVRAELPVREPGAMIRPVPSPTEQDVPPLELPKRTPQPPPDREQAPISFVPDTSQPEPTPDEPTQPEPVHSEPSQFERPRGNDPEQPEQSEQSEQPVFGQARVATESRNGTGPRPDTGTAPEPLPPGEATPMEPSLLDLPAVSQEDESPIFASLESEWFTRRKPLNGRPQPTPPEEPKEPKESKESSPEPESPVLTESAPRPTPALPKRSPAPTPPPAPQAPAAQASPTEQPAASGSADGQPIENWTSPGDIGWRRAAELSQQKEQEKAALTSNGLPQRVPGKNLVPGAAPDEKMPPAAPKTKPNQKKASGLSSFQQGVSRARSDRPQKQTEESNNEGWDAP